MYSSHRKFCYEFQKFQMPVKCPWGDNSESLLLRAARTHNLIPPLETAVDNMSVSKMPWPEYHWKYISIMMKKLSKEQGSSH